MIFPFDPEDLDLGGQFLVVDDPDLVEQLERHLDYRDANIARDVTMLKLFDRLPTLDPFLLHEALRANKLEVANCYFRLSPADKSEMLEFVALQVETLIGLCFGGAAAGGGQAKRLSTLLLAEGDSPELAPLRDAMRMEAEEFAQAMFCWKAVLYYRWRSRALAVAGEEQRAARSAQRRAPARFDPETAPFVRVAVGQLGGHDVRLRAAHRRDVPHLRRGVRGAPPRSRRGEPFRRFLMDGPKLFARLGERMGRLEQLVSYWQHQFPGSCAPASCAPRPSSTACAI